MQNHVEIFDSKGGTRPLESFSQDELDAIPPGLRARFDTLHKAATAASAAERKIRDCTLKVREARYEVEKRQLRLSEISPPISFHELWKQQVGKGTPIPAEIAEKIEHIKGAIVEAQEAHALAQDALVAAQRAVIPLRKAQAAAFENYLAKNPARSFKDVHHEMAANYRKPEPEQRQMLSMVDAIAAGTKEAPRRRHPQSAPGLGFRRGGTTQRPAMPALRPKLPSEL